MGAGVRLWVTERVGSVAVYSTMPMLYHVRFHLYWLFSTGFYEFLFLL